MNQRGQWIMVLAIVALLASVLVVGMKFGPAEARVTVGGTAPAFAAPRLPSGDSVALAAYRGDVVLLNIWATWCLPCEAEMPSMQRLHEALGSEGLRVVAVSVDNADAQRVWSWVRERNLTFDILHDRSGRIERTYHTTGVPESFVIDRHGVIVKKVIGATEWDHETHQALFRRLLAEAP